MENMNKVLLTLLIVCFGTNVYSCSYSERTNKEMFDDAKNIFRARIIATKLVTEKLMIKTMKLCMQLIDS